MTAKLTPHALRCILAEHEQHPTEPPHAGTLESLSPSPKLRAVIHEIRESAAETASRYSLAYDPAVDAAARGLLSASCLSGAQLEALQARLASEHQPITDRAAWSEPVAPTWSPAGIPDLPTTKGGTGDPLPVGMHEPRWVRFVPSTATLFWMAVSACLALLLARAEGWL